MGFTVVANRDDGDIVSLVLIGMVEIKAAGFDF